MPELFGGDGGSGSFEPEIGASVGPEEIPIPEDCVLHEGKNAMRSTPDNASHALLAVDERFVESRRVTSVRLSCIGKCPVKSVMQLRMDRNSLEVGVSVSSDNAFECLRRGLQP